MTGDRAQQRVALSPIWGYHHGFGELILTAHYPEPGEVGPGWITIDHADPRILIGAELAVQIALGKEMPAAKLYTTCVCSPEFRPPHPHGHHLVGAKLEVRGRDRKVIYILREHLFDLDAYVAEWPD